MMRPLGMPPMPSAMSSPSDPVDVASGGPPSAQVALAYRGRVEKAEASGDGNRRGGGECEPSAGSPSRSEPEPERGRTTFEHPCGLLDPPARPASVMVAPRARKSASSDPVAREFRGRTMTVLR